MENNEKTEGSTKNHSQKIEDIVKERALVVEKNALKQAIFYNTTALKWAQGNFWQTNVLVILTGISGITTLAIFAQPIIRNNIVASNIVVIFAGIASIIVTILTPLITTHNPSLRADLHTKAFKSFKALALQALQLRTYDIPDKSASDSDLITQIKELEKLLGEVECPLLPTWVKTKENQQKYIEEYQLKRETTTSKQETELQSLSSLIKPYRKKRVVVLPKSRGRIVLTSQKTALDFG